MQKNGKFQHPVDGRSGSANRSSGVAHTNQPGISSRSANFGKPPKASMKSGGRKRNTKGSY